MVPTVAFPLLMPSTLHCRPFCDPASEGTNWILVPRRTVDVVGVIDKVTAVVLLLLHPARAMLRAIARPSHPAHTFMLLSPIFSDSFCPVRAYASCTQNVRLTVNMKVLAGSKKFILWVFTW